MKIRPAGVKVCQCGRTDIQTDMTKLTFAFHNFANAPKNGYRKEGWVSLQWLRVASETGGGSCLVGGK